MKDRLQFRQHEEIFATRGEAINYIYSEIALSRGEMQSKDYKNAFSLFGEPTILAYKNEEDESNPHVILAIGARTNNTTMPQENRYCIVDIDNTEKEIAVLDEKISEVISALTLNTIDSDTIDFTTIHEESGVTISGDVKVPQYNLFPDGRIYNNIIKTENGIFLHVNARYDEDTNILTFEVNDDILEFRIGNDSLVSGEYKTSDESLHLKMKSGNEVTVSLEKLIDEWTVEGEASSSPIVLTREEVGSGDGTNAHFHTEPWQDVLKADVRIDPNVPHNILKKSSNGQFLSVNGVARDIAYWSGTTETTVQEALDTLSRIKVSTDSTNIVTTKVDGIFATASLEYEQSNNRLVFKTSSSNGEKVVNINLNTVRIDDEHTSYDSSTEILSIPYVDGNGQYTYAKINLGGLLRDWEWTINNYGHNVELQKVRSIEGSDQLSADVVIRKDRTNILEDIDHQLYVGGTADNIIYEQLISGDITVKDKIDELLEKTNNLNVSAATISATIGTCYDPSNSVENHVTALEDAIVEKVGNIVAKDSSVDVSGEKLEKQVKVNLGATTSDNKVNIITLNTDGIFATVDLTYDDTTNRLTFKTTNGEKQIALTSNSIIDKIYYDSDREAIIIEYTVNGQRMPDVVVPVRGLINEIDVRDTNTINLTKTIAPSGSTSPDIITADVIVSDANDNILEVTQGGLYASGSQIEDNKNNISSLQTRVLVAEEQINAISSNLTEESENRVAADTLLGSEINAERERAERSETALQTAIENESTRAQSVETTLDSKIDGEITRATAAEDTLSNKIDGEITRATNAEATLGNNIITEKERAQDAETALGERITSETTRATAAEVSLTNRIANAETSIATNVSNLEHLIEDEANARQQGDRNIASSISNLETNISNETSRATAKENELTANVSTLDGKIIAEKERAQDAENNLSSAISTEVSDRTQAVTAEKTRAIAAETALQTLINDEATRATNKEGELTTAISAEVTRAQGVENIISGNVVTEAQIARTKEGELQTAIDGLTNRVTTTESSIIAETTRAISAETALQTAIENESTRAANVETTLSTKIDAVAITSEDSATLDLTVTDGRKISGNVLVANGTNNIIKATADSSLGTGLYASVDLSYNAGTNTLTLATSDGTVKDIALSAGSIIDSISYDPIGKNLVIIYTKDGQPTTVTIPLEDLFIDWTVQNDHMGAIILHKENGTSGQPDVLSAEVVVSELSNNILVNDQGSLYVDGSQIETNTQSINELNDAISAIESTISGITGDVATKQYVSGYTYDKNTIDEKIAESGTFDPTQYYNKTATDALLVNKADTATTYTKTEVDNKVSTATDDMATKTYVSGYTYKKSETSGATEISTALSEKADSSTVDSLSDYVDGLPSSFANSDSVEFTVSGTTVSADVINIDCGEY